MLYIILALKVDDNRPIQLRNPLVFNVQYIFMLLSFILILLLDIKDANN